MTFGAIGRELKRRGHRVTVFHAAELAPKVAREDLDFWPLQNHGFSVQQYVDLAKQQDGHSLRNFLTYATASARMFCEEAPGAFASASIDSVIVDMAEPGGATAAEMAGLPFVTVCNALPLNSEPGVPPDFLPWRYRDGAAARLRNRLAYAARDWMIRPLHSILNHYRRQFALRPYRRPDDSFSPFAQITQLVPEFDLPREHLPAHFHYVGPYRRDSERTIPFPYERLDGSPIIYASLGTVFAERLDIWKAIVEGCSGLDAQLVLSFGARDLQLLGNLPANAIVAAYAPQRELLERASLFITHAGLNSAMEALNACIPMLAIPITGDQFGVAARIAYSRTGEIIPAAKCSPARISAAVQKILRENPYRGALASIRAAIGKTQGAAAAAEIVEQVTENGRPLSRAEFGG